MTNREKKDWLAVQYPLTVIGDRYNGTYSGAKWLAFPLDYNDIPSGVDDSDVECSQFWEEYKGPVGKGAYASDAVVDLIQQMRISEPEESEDERIRVRDFMMKQFFRPISPDLADALADAIIKIKAEDTALNKKQKENPQSADSIPSDCASDAKCEDRSPKHTDSFGTDIRDTPAYWRGWDDAMKQKDQKHPNGCFTCDEYKKGYEAGRLNGFTAGYNKAMKEQKPIQTEEEREYVKTLKGLVSDFVRDCGDCITDVGYYQRICDWLDGRHIEQKPAVWSEEDEHRLKLIRQCIVSCPSISGVDGNEVELLEFLDSLHPSWKPSEEQMKAFRSYIKDFQEKAEAAVGGWNNFDVMIRLFEQLKKL